MSSPFDCFPLEIIIEIASVAPGAWLALAVAYPPFGRYTLTDAGRADAVRAFGWVETEAEGSERWYLNGLPHRDDGPAIINSDGTKCWLHHGQLHRDGDPAILRPDGMKVWYRHGFHHRDDGPAIINSDGTKCWYNNNKLHRDDGPAVIRSDGTKYWYRHDVLIKTE